MSVPVRRRGEAAKPRGSVIRGAGARPDGERVALLLRNSSEEQALRETTEIQLDYLTGYCELNGLTIAGIYRDEGVSGTLLLGDRPDGRRLISDAATGAFETVLVYRLDRLARKLSVLMDAWERLDGYGVALKSATETFDTSTPFGRAMFQFLGVIAELEKETFKERTTGGRDKAARSGKYTGGPIPLGLDVDEHGYYVVGQLQMGDLGMTEAEWVAGFFDRLAYGGATLNGERVALSALGVPCRKRYPPARSGRSKAKPKTEPEVIKTDWAISTLEKIAHNRLYMGTGRVRSANGDQCRPVPAIVPVETWEAAQRALTKNQTWSKRNAKRDYLLRGLIRCGECGHAYSGAAKGRTTVYRCISDGAGAPGARCHAGSITCDTLDQAVWAEVRKLADDPHAYLEDAQAQQRALAAQASEGDAERKRLARQVAECEPQRQMILGQYRKGRIGLESCDAQLDEIAAEERGLRERLDAFRMRAELASASEAYLGEVGSSLLLLAETVAEIERREDRPAMRHLIEKLVTGVTLSTELLGVVNVRQRKRVTAEVTLALAAGAVVADLTACRSGHNDPSPLPPVSLVVLLTLSA